jgi:hypothetical protein
VPLATNMAKMLNNASSDRDWAGHNPLR